MTEPRDAPVDQADRDRLASEPRTTFFVEAGAGTGKTAAIVRRITSLIARGEVVAERLVAITFTEAAAAELRSRIRERLEETATVDPEDLARGNCVAALESLDRAVISTVHAFAGLILRLHPLEAGLPPVIETLDEIEQELRFSTVFRTWFDALPVASPAGEAVRHALLLGLTGTHIREVARGLAENYDVLEADTVWACDAAEPTAGVAARLGNEIAGLLRAVAGIDDPVADRVRTAAFATERLLSARGDDEAIGALRLFTVSAQAPHRTAAARGFPDPDQGKAIRDRFLAALDDAERVLAAHRRAALCRLLPALRDLVLADAAVRRRNGQATFHDLLTWARDLLRDRPDVRRRLQRQWDCIVVDEFQDTDPLQAEIAFYLAADPDGDPAATWLTQRLRPGVLCLVGDPKQSIYRFRRADIALYETIRALLGGAAAPATSLSLRQNFRSRPGILRAVNTHFGDRGHMAADPGRQPAYVPLEPDGPDGLGNVHRVGGLTSGNAAEVWTAEADAVARIARRAVDEGWLVTDRESPGALRPARLRDICVLMPSRTNLRRLERAFEGHDVAYRLESGALIIATQEVRELLACLRAIDDPSDQVATVAALRSPAYGCSDPELLDWAGRDGRFKPGRPSLDDGSRVAAALEDLATRSGRRHEQSVARLVEQLCEERLLLVGAYGDPRPREMWRRYRWVIDRARAFTATGRGTLRTFCDWMEMLAERAVMDTGGASADADEDAVRVMTIHRAKGLEFPIVILTGLGSTPNNPAPAIIVDRLNRTLEARVGYADARFATSGHEPRGADEKELAALENVRLLYVAMTRARDHLVVPLFRKAGRHGGEGTATHASRLEASLATLEVDRLTLSDQPALSDHGPLPPSAADPTASQAAEDDWAQRRKRALDGLAWYRTASPTGLAHLPEVEPDPEPEQDLSDQVAASRRGRGATALGRAVHAVLQAIDLRSLDQLGALAAAQASAEGIPDRAPDVAELVRAAAVSDAVRRALRSPRMWREMPVGAEVEGVLLEGFIDLLYEDGDGGLVVVDYKTDQVAGAQIDARLAEYRVQGGAYALLLEAATGRTVRRVEFVFVRPAVTRALTDVAELREQALTAVRAQRAGPVAVP